MTPLDRIVNEEKLHSQVIWMFPNVQRVQLAIRKAASITL